MLTRYLLLALLSFSISACVRAPSFVPGEPLAVSDSAALCAALNSSGERVVSFRALLDASISDSGGESGSFRYAVVGKDSDKLRIDLLPREGAFTLALMTVRGDQALFLNTQEKQAVYGCSVDQALEKLIGLRGLTQAAVKALVLGRLAKLDCNRVTAHRPDQQRVIFLEQGTQIAWEVDAESLDLRRAYFLNQTGAKITAVAARDESAGVPVIEVSVYKPVAATVEMKLVKLNKNPEVAEALFTVGVPAGYSGEGC
jgi:hypothetical protein